MPARPEPLNPTPDWCYRCGHRIWGLAYYDQPTPVARNPFYCSLECAGIPGALDGPASRAAARTVN